MANGICIYAETCGSKLEPVFAELVSAASKIKETTGEKLQALLVAEDTDSLKAEIAALGVDEIYVLKTGRDCLMQDDALSQAIADALKKIDPSSVLIPATPVGRSIFSRVAAKLECGLTADCTELLVGTREDGTYYVKQNKPSYGDNIFVTIVTKEGVYPQMMTVRPGVYQPVEADASRQAQAVDLDIVVGESQLEVVEVMDSDSNADSIMSAEIVIAGGRGVLAEGNFELMEKFAQKLGAAIGGTRPLADSGLIPFDHQIGQTGFTIRPKICISLGASGAIQHTEGIKDTKLMVAVNTDENAPIFNISDYGLVGDIHDVLESFLELD